MTTNFRKSLACLAAIVLALAVDPLSARTPRDFDGDGKADMLVEVHLYNPYRYFGWDDWYIARYEVCSITTPVLRPGCWGTRLTWPDQVHLTARFRGGNTHLLLVQDGHGRTFVGDRDRAILVPLLADHNWRGQHAADFDANGVDDLVWYNAGTRTTALWLLDASSQVVGSTVLMAGSGWTVTHVADFDGDGKGDLVWRNQDTGGTALWLMDGARFAGGAVLLELPDWRVALTGDFNADGRSDLVWRNVLTGETALWLMDGLTFVGGAIVVPPGDWSPTHAADLDGDRRSDLIWHNPLTGRVHAWLMDGLTMKVGASITRPGHTVVTTGDYDGDGLDDLVWLESATGVNFVQRMHGLTALGSPIWVTPHVLDGWSKYLVVP
jgi:hypothetical protein